MLYCLLLDLFHTEPKHSVLVNHRLRLTNGIDDIDRERPFIIFIANFSNVPRKIPKHMVL